MRRIGLRLALLLLAGLPVRAQIINTVAGGGPNNLPATSANLNGAASTAVNPSGVAYISAVFGNRIFKVDTSGTLTIYGGTGVAGFSGDGGPATAAMLNSPVGLSLDAAGNLYFADAGNNRIRRIDAVSGVITTVAGNGTIGYNGDGILATAAYLHNPTRTLVDNQGNLYFSDELNYRVRRVDAVTGIITTVAGNGSTAYTGDNIPATSAGLYNPVGLALDSSGNLYIGDVSHGRIRHVVLSTGIITTLAGNGTTGCFPESGAATSVGIAQAFGLALDGLGNLFVADYACSLVHKINIAGGTVTTAAGMNGSFGFSGDGGPATSAKFNNAVEVSADSSGNLFIADGNNNRIRRVDHATAVITTFAGNGFTSYGGDGYAATSGSLRSPQSLTVDSSGNQFIADYQNHVIRRVDGATGVMTTVAGNGVAGFNGDNILATSASLYYPSGTAIDSHGNLFIADFNNNRVRRVDALTGKITTVAGTGAACSSSTLACGDGGPATSAQLHQPGTLAFDVAGNLFIADQADQRIRRVSAGVGGLITGGTGETISTVVGNGNICSSGTSACGDAGPATSANLRNPFAMAFDAAGNFYFADESDNRVRRYLWARRPRSPVRATKSFPQWSALERQGLAERGA